MKNGIHRDHPPLKERDSEIQLTTHVEGITCNDEIEGTPVVMHFYYKFIRDLIVMA